MGFFKEFKEFASKGSLVDIAVAFVIGAAFAKIVTSFTEGIVSPLIGLLTGGIDFSSRQWELLQSTIVANEAGGIRSGHPALVLQWGKFVTATIDFIIVAFAMFLIVKFINRNKMKEAAAPTPPTASEVLLMEIRDALKK